MLNNVAQTVVFSASLMVLSAMSVALAAYLESLFKIGLFFIPFGLCAIVPSLHEPAPNGISAVSVIVEVAAVWIGFFAAAYLVTGSSAAIGWLVGLVLFLVTVPIALFTPRRRR